MSNRGVHLLGALLVLLVASALPARPPRRRPPRRRTRRPPATAAGCYPAGDAAVACYQRPSAYGFLLNVPGDIGGLARDAFRRESLVPIAGVAVATAGLLLVDQKLSDAAHRAGRAAHISSNGETAKLSSAVPIPYPTDVGSGIYYLGDGMLPVAITVGMLGYGLWTSDPRALQTTSHLAEGLVSVAIVAQTIKHLTGRQSPSRATEDGGRWRPLTDPREYQRNVPAFDAFPSGHLATAMVTVTVLANDYPDHPLIRPVGYGLMTLLGFQMMNNDVHWASDYPLALAIGYGLGKQAVSRGRTVVRAEDAPGEALRRAPSPTVQVLPFPVRDGGGLAVAGTF